VVTSARLIAGKELEQSRSGLTSDSHDCTIAGNIKEEAVRSTRREGASTPGRSATNTDLIVRDRGSLALQ